MDLIKLFISIIVCLASFTAHASPTDLSGTYHCGGSEVNTNEAFTCLMTMKKTDQTYEIKSSCSDKTAYVGTGIYDQAKQVLSVAFINPKNAEETGVILVDVKEKNKLASTWTYLNKTVVSNGYCVKA